MSPILGSRGISPRSYGFAGAGKPNAPVSVSATDVGTSRAYNNGAASVAFTSGGDNGAPITSFTVTSSPGSFTATGSSSPLTVTGLQSATSYTFTVTATNSVGQGGWDYPHTKFLNDQSGKLCSLDRKQTVSNLRRAFTRCRSNST